MSVHSELSPLIDVMLQRQASDLILTENQPPIIRVVGDLEPLAGMRLTAPDIRRIAYSLMTEEQQKTFEQTQEMDCSFGIPGTARFRVNIFQQQGAPGVVIRMLPSQIPTIESLGVPAIVKDWLNVPHGIIITTGPTGSGKSTSQAAMIGYLNDRKKYHVISIEDPIEYVHTHNKCTIEQREVGRDTDSFGAALKRVFRQSPDVIMIGEMRDKETFETALQLAETGHLVLATLHTPDAAQTIDRILDIFPPHQQEQVKVQLAGCLQAVVSQQLMPRMDGSGRVLAYEIMVATPAVRNLIREHATEQIPTVLQTGASFGMCTMDSCLKDLYDKKIISYETAISRVKNPQEFMLHGKAEGARKRNW